MPDFDAAGMFDVDGAFTDTGRSSLVTAAGEDHVNTKVFDDVKDMNGLAKVFADTKSKLGQKLENVIQKPAENATDEEISTYKAALATASGAPEKAEDYEFFKSEKLPDGMERSQEAEDQFRAVFFEHKIPKETVTALTKVFEEFQVGDFGRMQETVAANDAKTADDAQKAFDTECTAIKTDWPGEKLSLNARISLAAIQQFGDDELIGKLKEAKMYENATDLSKWRESGVPLNTLRIFHKIGLATLDAKALGNPNGSVLTDTEKVKNMYPNTKD